MENKYNMTIGQNIFLAKRNLVDNIYSNARLEGLNITFPQTKTILEGIKRRLLDMGLVGGTNIIPVLVSPSSDPRAFLVRGSIIAIRKEDAENIIIKV